MFETQERRAQQQEAARRALGLIQQEDGQWYHAAPRCLGRGGMGSGSYQLELSPVRGGHLGPALKRVPTRGKQMQVPRDDLEGSTGGGVETGAQGLDCTPRTPSYSPCHTHTSST